MRNQKLPSSFAMIAYGVTFSGEGFAWAVRPKLPRSHSDVVLMGNKRWVVQGAFSPVTAAELLHWSKHVRAFNGPAGGIGS